MGPDPLGHYTSNRSPLKQAKDFADTYINPKTHPHPPASAVMSSFDFLQQQNTPTATATATRTAGVGAGEQSSAGASVMDPDDPMRKITELNELLRTRADLKRKDLFSAPGQ
jgi:hypothetical protein